ncbi:unknown protein [Seminavis robusta]|uniref:CCHC-type domain-containing protein n=1 Tax=Seminavis robusta TaxID=568900 RepID=A0A9N8HU55_9STRA|nr:unknown protein [Seminavis robusta]|eukprot:Sro1696_g291840.1 n/a (374) ;mRNA; f:12352-13473
MTPHMVGESNYVYNRYIQEPYVRENMTLVYSLLKANTEESLWNKCLETYETFDPYQQGGPLMLILILHRIQDSSEAAILRVRGSLKKLKIRDLEGESVDTAVTLIKTVTDLLTSNAREGKSFIPDDYTETVLDIFQSSSNSQFNKTFKDVKDAALAESDRTSKLPVYPSISELCDQAANMYNRLARQPDGWVKSSKKKASGFQAQANTNSRGGGGPPLKCWNCGSPDHMMPKCPKPKDESRIAKARKAFLDAKKKSGNSSKDKHSRLTKMSEDGKPLIQNKHGQFVLNQKVWKEMQTDRAMMGVICDHYRNSAGGSQTNEGASSSPPTDDTSSGNADQSASAQTDSASRTVSIHDAVNYMTNRWNTAASHMSN